MLRHLKHWHAPDKAAGITHTARITGKAAPTFDGKYDAPHVMRHTAATWMRKRGVPSVEAANYLGMSFETYERVYAHMAPDFQATAAGLKSKF